jgi:hypothetical protein
MWIAAFFLCEQVGVAVGQVALTLAVILFGENGGWRYSFLVESAVLVGFCAIAYVLIPQRYFVGQEGEQDQKKTVRTLNY